MAGKKIKPKKELVPTDIIAAEFAYIGQTAFQANEDRIRVLSFYLVTVGSLVGAILSSQLKESTGIYWAFTGLFALLMVFGILTLRELIQLRSAWTESVRAMDQIKDFLVGQDEAYKDAFRWNKDNIPEVKPSSISFLQAWQVAILTAVMLGCAVQYLGFAQGLNLFPAAVLLGMIALAIQYRYFRGKFAAIQP